jgi:hypothetical protein
VGTGLICWPFAGSVSFCGRSRSRLTANIGITAVPAGDAAFAVAAACTLVL